jgi:diguanylate cyclase (GGDEF)-like protein
MPAKFVAAATSLDVGTLFVVAICVTLLLGLFLLYAWSQERIRALGWWSGAYFIGGASGIFWRFGEKIVPAGLTDAATILLFAAVGMIWSGARVFHGRPVHRLGMVYGAAFWLAASFSPAFAESAASRVVVSALIVASYTFLTASELWRERRKSLIRRWPALFVPMLHGAIFLFPVALATLSPADDGAQSFARGWIVVFAIEIILYVVGTAFMVLILAKDRTMRAYKTAAATDPLTGLLNRRGFFEETATLCTRRRKAKAPVTLLAFDLDRFKSINDAHGHAAGDDVLRVFAEVARDNLRANDIVGRLGGEEFVALLPANAAEAGIAAERVRAALAATAIVRDGKTIAVTVSIGLACCAPTVAVDALIAQADEALYRAKANGRNRIEIAADTPSAASAAASAQPQENARGVRRRRNQKGAVDDGALGSFAP